MKQNDPNDLHDTVKLQEILDIMSIVKDCSFVPRKCHFRTLRFMFKQNEKLKKQLHYQWKHQIKLMLFGSMRDNEDDNHYY